MNHKTLTVLCGVPCWSENSEGPSRKDDVFVLVILGKVSSTQHFYHGDILFLSSSLIGVFHYNTPKIFMPSLLFFLLGLACMLLRTYLCSLWTFSSKNVAFSVMSSGLISAPKHAPRKCCSPDEWESVVTHLECAWLYPTGNQVWAHQWSTPWVESLGILSEPCLPANTSLHHSWNSLH